MRDILLDHFRRYTLAYLLASLFFAMASGSQFVDTFSVLTREQAAALAWWQLLALCAKPLLSGLAAVLAFLNKHTSSIPPPSNNTQPPFSRP